MTDVIENLRVGRPFNAIFCGFEILFRLVLAAVVYALPMHIFTADVGIYWNRAHGISLHDLPYRDFVWEYPPLTVFPLLFMPLAGERESLFVFLFVVITIACEYASLCVLRQSKREEWAEITLYWSATVLPLATLTYFRFDFISVLFATIALVAVERRRSAVLPIFLGFMAKLWPIFFVITLFAQRRFRQAANIVFVCALGTGVWWAFAPQGFLTFLRFRQGDGFQIESIPGSILMLAGRNFTYGFGALNVSDAGCHWIQVLMSLATVLGPAALGLAGLKTKHRDDIALTAGVVGFVLCTSRLISPQFITWLAPLAASLWARERRLGYIYGLLVALTVMVLLFYHSLIKYGLFSELIVVARNCVLVWWTVAALRQAFRPRRE